MIALLQQTANAKEISTEIHINTGPEKVWEILTDLDSYADWNPFITSISGSLEKGEKLYVNIQPPGKKAMAFSPKVIQKDNGRSISWLGHVLFKGLFDGEHRFELIDNGDGTTTFIQSEQFKGALVFLFNKSMHQSTMEGFRAMNERLKELAESNTWCGK